MNRKDFLTQSSLLALAGTMLPLSGFANNDQTDFFRLAKISWSLTMANTHSPSCINAVW